MRARLRATRSQGGQAFVLVAVILVALLTGIGLAFDASYDYYNSALAERAAASAALSGVVFMPNQFVHANAVPAGSRNDATERAIDEAVRNGFTSSEVTATKVYDSSGGLIQTQLQVTISHTFPTLFMRIFGFSTLSVKRTAIAAYLPPVSIGQPGGQGGSTVSELGSGSSNYYFMRELGFGADRANGDPFGPNPGYEFGPPPGNALSPPSTDVHQISAQTGSDTVDATLPARGGYNYQVHLPPGYTGYVQVYNAVFGPDNAPHNNCDNNKAVIISGFLLGSISPCSTFPTGCTTDCYYYHEEDGVTIPDKTTFNAMEYSLFRVSNVFLRSSDVELSKFTVLPIDATNWSQSSAQYLDMNTAKTVTQNYSLLSGAPTNMAVYHNWANVTNYNGAGDVDASGNKLVINQTKYAPLLTGAASTGSTYRLRVDSLNYDGTNPTSTCVVATGNGCGAAHKGYAVRVVNGSGVPCTTCNVSSWTDMDIYTPISTVGGGSFAVPLFQLPSAYAGYTIYVDIFDPGDIGGTGNVDINLLSAPTSGTTNCTGPIATPTSPLTVTVKDLGTSQGSTTQTLVGTPATATVRVTSSGSVLYNGHWVEMLIPIPSTYTPGTNTTWCLQYATSTGVTATDTLAAVVGLQGSPEHMIIG